MGEEKRGVSRRTLLASGAAVTAGAASGLFRIPALADNPRGHALFDAKPIKATFPPGAGVGLHVAGPGRGAQNSTVFDFTGSVAGAEIRGPAVLTVGGAPPRAVEFDADVRVIRGAFLDRVGDRREGSFAFL